MVQLDYSVLGNPMGPSVALLHGILGSGNNWRGFIGKLSQKRPDLRFVLIDLRNHGFSPHCHADNNLLQSAIDVLELQKNVGSFQAIIGHSFGGKVALQCANIPFHSEIEQVWALDSSPGKIEKIIKMQDEKDKKEVALVLSMLNKVTLPVSRRSQLKNQLLEMGASTMISQWMTTNLQKTDQGYIWRFNLQGIQEMIQDYFDQDLWSVLEDPALDIETHLVRATLSDRWDSETLERLEQLPSRSIVHHLEAGHWVHVDNPEGLLTILEENLLADI